MGNVCPSIYSERCRAGDSGSTLVEFNPEGLNVGTWQNEGKTKTGGKETCMADVGSPGAVRALGCALLLGQAAAALPCCPGGLWP